MPSRLGSGQRILIMAHGAGSCADFLARAFPAHTCGMATEYLEDRTGAVETVAARLLAAAQDAHRHGCSPVLGGVSVGAHAAAIAALAAPAHLLAGCVLVMPAWTGPASLDSATALAAREVADVTAAGVLRRLDADPVLRGDWVAGELRSAWRDRPSLAAELAAAAGSSAPRLEELARLRLPTLVLALADDPVHPLQVSLEWAAAVPGADFDVIPRDAPGDDRAVFGRRVGTWHRRRFNVSRLCRP